MKDAVKLFRGKYDFLSNMYAATFEWDGRTYQNSANAGKGCREEGPLVHSVGLDCKLTPLRKTI